MPSPKPPDFRKLEPIECVHYRDQLRSARYAALADAEGFGEICFALESLGLRLLGQQGTLDKYKDRIAIYAQQSPVLSELAARTPSWFKSFDALYKTVQAARNDAMHIGAYARYATEAAIELCIGMEEALMANVKRTVGNVMVSSPVTVSHWQPLAHARQLMLMHSFSFLPVRLGQSWSLISELGLAKFLSVDSGIRKVRLGMTIQSAEAAGMETIHLSNGQLLQATMTVEEVLQNSRVSSGPMLWLVVDEEHADHLAGVLSPFELM